MDIVTDAVASINQNLDEEVIKRFENHKFSHYNNSLPSSKSAMSLTYALPSSTASIPNTHPVKPKISQHQIVKQPFSYSNFQFTPCYYGLYFLRL